MLASEPLADFRHWMIATTWIAKSPSDHHPSRHTRGIGKHDVVSITPVHQSVGIVGYGTQIWRGNRSQEAIYFAHYI